MLLYFKGGKNMNQSLILDLLENNARLTSQDLADILTGKKKLPEKEWFFNYLGEPMQH